MRATTKMRILEAMARIGPARGHEIVAEADGDIRSIYTSLDRWLRLGLVSVKGEPQDRVWTITQAGRDVAKALRQLHDAEPL